MDNIQEANLVQSDIREGFVAITYRDNKKDFGAINTFTIFEELNSILRNGVYSVYGFNVYSASLGVRGICDVIEFIKDDNGIFLNGVSGRWRPFPVEYKHGQAKKWDMDTLQLCCYAMCLEEMFCYKIVSGAIYYGKTRRRLEVVFTEPLRDKVKKALLEMHGLFKRKHTPVVKEHKGCKSCALYNSCFCEIFSKKPVEIYIAEKLDVL